MLQRVKEVQESDLRMDGALARNIQRVLAVTQADIDAAAAQGKSWLVKRVVKVNDPLDNMRGGTQLVIKQNSIQPGQNVMRVLYSGNSKTVGPAVAPLSLPGAAADDILSLIAFGGTEQRNLPAGYTQCSYIYVMANSYLTTDINPSYDGKYEFDFQTTTLGSSGATSYLGVRPSSSGNGGIRVARISTQVFRIYGFGAYQDSTTTAAANTRYKFVWDNQHAVMTTGSTTVLDLTFTGTQDCAYPITINGWNSAGSVTPGSEDIFVYGFKAWNAQGELVADYVPAKNANNEVGFYDMVSESFKGPTTGTFAAGPDTAPTPSTPIDIVCNNGVLVFTPNLLDMASENIVLGKYINNSGVVTDSGPNFYNSKYIPVSAGQSYTWSTSSSINYFSIMEYDSSKTFTKRTLFSNAGTSGSITLRNDTAFILIGSNMDGTDASLDKIAAVDWQIELGSSATSYRPYSENKVYTVGPIETIAIKDDQNATVSTATCEDLLSIGTYTDEQEVISGAVTRKVGVLVCDGTEQIYMPATNVFRIVLPGGKPQDSLPGGCTHYKFNQSASTPAQDKNFAIYKATYSGVAQCCFGVRESSFNSLAGFQAFVASQYAAGTPIIIIYPLATETTESVTGQPMQTAAGDNTAEITQAGMGGLELEVEYIEA